MTKSEAVANDVSALLRARSPLLWVVTKEEARVERYLIEAAIATTYVPMIWDAAQGVTDMSGKSEPSFGGMDPGETLAAILREAQAPAGRGTRRVWILRDMHKWLEGSIGIQTLRQIRNLYRQLPATGLDNAQAIVILTSSTIVPDELTTEVTVIEWPLPDREEIAGILDAVLGSIEDNETRERAAPNGAYDSAVDAAVGLTGEEAAACYARSLVQLRRIDPRTVAQEKKRVIARERVLEWFDPIPGGLSAVGGLENLKGWLVARAAAYSPAAREYGLPAPKGALLVGIPGCGKSLTAKAFPTAWGVPLLRLDLGALRSKFVGESEANIRKAFGVIESVGRCVVWLDEIEKALQGATSASADGGVSADALGSILSWMQDRQGEAFVIATANDVQALPPELLRKGRFDEVWWVDLPNTTERAAIAKAALTAHGRGHLDTIDLPAIAEVTQGFTGSEIAALVPDAMFVAFADGQREIRTDDLLQAATTTTPLSKTASEKITKLREWAASGRARAASRGDAEPKATKTRVGVVLDF